MHFFLSQWIHWKREKRLEGGLWGLTWSCLTCSWRACWVLAAICDTCRSFVEHRCLSPSISSAQCLCLSSNSWQVSSSFSSKLTCGKGEDISVRICLVQFTTQERCLLIVKQQLGTCSSCSSVSLSSSLCSRRSISDSSVVIGERIPPEVSERALGSSAESGELASPFPLDVDPTLFKPAL